MIDLGNDDENTNFGLDSCSLHNYQRQSMPNKVSTMHKSEKAVQQTSNYFKLVTFIIRYELKIMMTQFANGRNHETKKNESEKREERDRESFPIIICAFFIFAFVSFSSFFVLITLFDRKSCNIY